LLGVGEIYPDASTIGVEIAQNVEDVILGNQYGIVWNPGVEVARGIELNSVPALGHERLLLFLFGLITSVLFVNRLRMQK